MCTRTEVHFGASISYWKALCRKNSFGNVQSKNVVKKYQTIVLLGTSWKSFTDPCSRSYSFEYGFLWLKIFCWQFDGADVVRNLSGTSHVLHTHTKYTSLLFIQYFIWDHRRWNVDNGCSSVVTCMEAQSGIRLDRLAHWRADSLLGKHFFLGIGIGIYLGCFLPGGNWAHNTIIITKSRYSHPKITHSKKGFLAPVNPPVHFEWVENHSLFFWTDDIWTVPFCAGWAL